MSSRRKYALANRAAMATAVQITMVMKRLKPSMPTDPPTVLKAPGCECVVVHHSSESQFCTRAHTGSALSAAAAAMTTVTVAKSPLGARPRRNEENVSMSRPPTSRIRSGSSANQSTDGPAM
ncbi:unannotated protein [freshwater metagenome]|uniref:Unannotated protein n=1 Tax=freshwater metagenome TaxID=449393 RepID=A0A6J7KN25_9ZZZZ